MYARRPIVATLFAFSVLLNGCGGSRATPPVFPAMSSEGQLQAGARTDTTMQAATTMVAIDAGGAATGAFLADQDFTTFGTWASSTTKAIATAGVTNPAPQAVYQTQRVGHSFTYTIPGLSAGATYGVRLDFAEIYWSAAGKRVFNVAINGTNVLTNFDIFASAGAADTAVAESFSATASSTGTIAIVMTATTDNAAVNGIEITSGGSAAPSASPSASATPIASPSPTSSPSATPSATSTGTAPAAGIFINAGGAASGSFGADQDFTSLGTWASSTTATIDTSAVTNPAPQSVYQSERVGQSFTYTIPGLNAGTTYGVRLDFAETFWSAAGDRVFGVRINGTPVLTNFDIFAAAGAKNKAVSESFSATASSSGTIAIAFAATTNNALINGIEISSGSPGSGSGPTPIPTAVPTPVATPTPVSTAPASSFNDWTTYAYDAQRSGFNPNTAAITPASIANGGLHLAWQVAGSAGDDTQPIIATNVAGHKAIVIIGNHASMYAYDATTGVKVWGPTTLPTQNDQACGTAGVAGTPYYDAALGALFVAAGNGTSPNHVVLYQLNVATGGITNSVDVTPALLTGETVSGHTAITYANGSLYLGTGSNCETASWRGRVVAVNPATLAIQNTFFTTYGVGGVNYGGGGVWGWGGVTADGSGNMYLSAGNAGTTGEGSGTIAAPFVPAPNEQAGYAEHLVKISGDLSTVEDSNYPGFNFQIGHSDLDYAGSPVVFQPSGCDVMTGTQGKGGTLVINDTTNLSTPASYLLSEPSGSANYVGNPAYSPSTGLLYAAVASSQDGSLEPPGMVAFAFPSCSSSILWHAAFGPDSFSYSSLGSRPRSAPTVTAGGVVFMGTPCTSNGSGGCTTPAASNGALWAVDASSGAVLGGGNPIIVTADHIRMAATVDGLWVWVMDNSGNLYGLTIDPTVPAIQVRAGRRVVPQVRYPQ